MLWSLHIVCKHNCLRLVQSNTSVRHRLKNHLRSHMGLLQHWNSSQVCVQARFTAVHTQDMSTMESSSASEAARSLQAIQCVEDHRVAQIPAPEGSNDSAWPVSKMMSITPQRFWILQKKTFFQAWATVASPCILWNMTSNTYGAVQILRQTGRTAETGKKSHVG